MNWDELTQEALDAVIDIDVKGTLLMTHEFGERMLKQGHGNIVQVGPTVIVRGSARAPGRRRGRRGARAWGRRRRPPEGGA